MINEYAFAYDSNVLEDPARANALRTGFTEVFLSVHFSMHFGWVSKIAGLIPALGKYLTPSGVFDMIKLSQVSSSRVKRDRHETITHTHLSQPARSR